MESRSRNLSKLGMILVLFGVVAATYTVMTMSYSPVGDLVPRSLERSDEENYEPAHEDGEGKHHEHHHEHHCHKKIGKMIVHFAILFFAIFGLASCLRLTCRGIARRSCRRYRQFEGYNPHHYHHEMQQYPYPQAQAQAIPVHAQVPPMQQPNRYPNIAPYGQPVNP